MIKGRKAYIDETGRVEFNGGGWWMETVTLNSRKHNLPKTEVVTTCVTRIREHRLCVCVCEVVSEAMEEKKCFFFDLSQRGSCGHVSSKYPFR